MVLALVLSGCMERDQPGKSAAGAKLPAADVAAGKAFAERECKACHGLDGKGAAPAIPHLAAQRERYLLAALKAYKEGKREHAALREIASNMTDADARNLAAYFAGLPPVQAAGGKDSTPVSPYEQGKSLAGACAKCHSEDGNSRIAGTPSLAGQQPHYLVAAIQEYLNKERKAAPMHALLPGLKKLDMESLVLYFASQAPAQRAAPPFGDAAAGEPLSAVCGGCHGAHGVSTDSATPSLAGQDARYLVDAIKAYRTTRKRESMRLYVTGLSDKDVQNIAAFYTVQKSRAVERGQTLVKDLTDKCERCHAAEADVPGMVVP
jgi:cytochrome c553